MIYAYDIDDVDVAVPFPHPANHISHYSELATALGCNIEEGRQIVHDFAGAASASIRLNPDTDWIATFSPFSLIPTPYRITVDGQQKWFGQ